MAYTTINPKQGTIVPNKRVGWKRCCWVMAVLVFTQCSQIVVALNVRGPPNQRIVPHVKDSKAIKARTSSSTRTKTRKCGITILNSGNSDAPVGLDAYRLIQVNGGFLVAFLVLAGLSTSLSSPDEMLMQENKMLVGVAKNTVSNVLGVAVPSSSTDLVAGALGEALAGITGALVSFLIQIGLSAEARAGVSAEARASTKTLVTGAIADSDYFIANSASIPLFEAIGFAPGLATLVGSVAASVPFQLVKLAPQQKERKIKEQQLLQDLLVEEASRKTKKTLFEDKNKGPVSVNPKELVPVLDASQFDFVEIFSDTTRWLGYSVLKDNFGETLVWGNDPFDRLYMGAILGLVAAFSSQLYADSLYIFFRSGPKAKRREIIQRQPADWTAIYFAKCYAAATLFGIYEYLQTPLTRWIQGMLAGGVEGCVGSSNFEACIQTYIENNAPGPSTEAQIRALITNLAMLGQRLEDIAGDTTLKDIQALLERWFAYFLDYVNAMLETGPLLQ